MICLDTSSMVAYLQGLEGKDVTLIDLRCLIKWPCFLPSP